MTKELMRLGMTVAHHLPLYLVDNLLVTTAKFIFGDLSRHGITMPKMGPIILKSKIGRSAVIDVGTLGLIKKGIIQIQVSIYMLGYDINLIYIPHIILLCWFINIPHFIYIL